VALLFFTINMPRNCYNFSESYVNVINSSFLGKLETIGGHSLGTLGFWNEEMWCKCFISGHGHIDVAAFIWSIEFPIKLVLWKH